MQKGTPLVLIASVSPSDGQALEVAFKELGWDRVLVHDAADAADQIDDRGRPAVLVIDSGLLEMAHDPQWRMLRVNNPELGTVVRCLVSCRGRDAAPVRSDEATFHAHPDDLEGLCHAVRTLALKPEACTP